MPGKLYIAIPLGATDAIPKNSNGSSPTKKTICCKLAVFAICFLIPFLVYHGVQTTGDEANKSKVQPTLLPGGGRDWTLDLTNNVIRSKHNPEFALGSLPLDPLILTTRDNDKAIRFSTDSLQRLSNGEQIPFDPLCLQFPTNVDTFSNWDYLLTGINWKEGVRCSRIEGGKKPMVEYHEGNFLLLDSEWALDVSMWKFTEGNTVNFVKVVSDPKTHWWQKKPKTLEYGGGRDWVLNVEDGTISLKNYPFLVLGRGSRSLSIMDADSDGVWKFDGDDLATLKSGNPIALFNLRGDAVVKTQNNESHYDVWRYIESKVISLVAESATNDSFVNGVVKIKFIDDNYLMIYEDGVSEEKALVLDVAFWNMVKYNTVNFVGGWEYRGSDYKA